MHSRAPDTFPDIVDRIQDSDRPQHFLAMDQSAETHRKQFGKFGIAVGDADDMEQKGDAARRMLASAPGLGDDFTGAIVHDNLFGLTDLDGKPLQRVLEDQGVVVIGKKLGLDKATGLATELSRLPQDLQNLVDIGVHMVKTRTTIKFGLPQHVEDAVEQMVAVQRAAAGNGKIAAVLEPEFLKDNTGRLGENERLMTLVLDSILRKIKREGLDSHPFFIKTSFPTAGSRSGEAINPEASGAAFKRICERAQIPPELLIVFLSGGHSPETSRSLLQEMAKVRENVGSSFSRANIERPYQRTFHDGQIDIPAGQAAIVLEGRKNRLAMEGRYQPSLEQATDAAELEIMLKVSQK